MWAPGAARAPGSGRAPRAVYAVAGAPRPRLLQLHALGARGRGVRVPLVEQDPGQARGQRVDVHLHVGRLRVVLGRALPRQRRRPPSSVLTCVAMFMHGSGTEHSWAGSWARVRHAVRRNDQVLYSCSANLTVLRVHVRTILEGRQSPLPARPQPCRGALACTRARKASVTRLQDAPQCWPPCSWGATLALSPGAQT